MAIGWSLSNSKASFVAVLWLLLTGCTPDLQPVALEQCRALELSGDVQVIVQANVDAAITLQVSQAVEVVQGDALQLSGTGAVILNCPTLTTIQSLGDTELTVTVGSHLRSVRAYGASQVALGEVNATELELRASGQARLALAKLDADSVLLQAGGQTEIALAGLAGHFEVNSAGEARVDASELRAQNVKVQGSGRGPLSVWATAHLHITDDVVIEPSVTGSPDLTDDREGSQ